MSETLFFVLELIGTIAFAASGAMVGLKKGMDIFGVAILGLCTAVGGGGIRDLVLGPPPSPSFSPPSGAAWSGGAVCTTWSCC